MNYFLYVTIMLYTFSVISNIRLADNFPTIFLHAIINILYFTISVHIIRQHLSWFNYPFAIIVVIYGSWSFTLNFGQLLFRIYKNITIYQESAILMISVIYTNIQFNHSKNLNYLIW